MKRDHILLFLLSLLIVALNVIWLAVDTRPPSWDASVHLNLTWKYWQVFKHLNVSFLRDIISISGYYPPLFHLTAVPAFAVLGPSLSSALIVNVFYFLVLLFSTYFTGKHLYNNQVGLLSSFLVCMYPFVLFMSRTLVLDLALMSMVALGFLLYLKSENFSERKYSILFGIVSGLGMLIKWTYCFFLIGPVLYSFWTSFFTEDSGKQRKVNFGIAAGSTIIIAMPWYSYNLIKFIKYSIQFSGIGASEGDPGVLTVHSVFYYAKNLLFQIQPVFFVLFLIGLTVFLFTLRRHNKVLLWWMVIPYVILTFISNKDERYTMPFLPAVSIMSSFWLFSLRNIRIKKGFIAGLVMFGVGQGLVTSFTAVPFYATQPPKHEDWRQKEVLSFINQEKLREFATVSVVANHSYWHSESLEFCAAQCGFPLLFNGFGSNLGQFADFVITKSGDLGPSFTLGRIPDARAEMLDEKSHFRKNFILAKKFPLPDTTELFVFKRVPGRLHQGEKIDQAVFVKKLLNALMKYFYEFQGLSIEVVAESNEKASQGIFKKIIVAADQLQIKNIVVHDAKIIFYDVELDAALLLEKEVIRIFAIREIEPALTITAQDLKDMMLIKARNVKEPSVIIQDGVIKVRGEVKGAELMFFGRVAFSGHLLYPDILKLKYGFCIIPSWFYEGFLEKPVSLAPTAEWPVYTKINEVTMLNDRITVK